MSREIVLLTGALGGIGSAVRSRLVEAGLAVIGIDMHPGAPGDAYRHVVADLGSLAAAPGAVDVLMDAIAAARTELSGGPLTALVNNAATQFVESLASIELPKVRRSLDVNVIAPLLLAQRLLPDLAENRGCIVNVSSIHARLTKPGFGAYSTSKAALSGLSRAMAVEWGQRVRVATIEPAAIATPMLEAGFEGRLADRAALDAVHPCGSIGTAEQVADWIHRLILDRSPFANGMLITIDGGIGSMLHDPVAP